MPDEPLRAVLDTNVFVRIVLSCRPESVAGALWDLFLAGHFRSVTSPALLAEIRDTFLSRHLVDLHGWSRDRIEGFVGTVADLSECVTPVGGPSIPELAVRDPDDQVLVDAAHEAGADAIVTQDRDLLDLPVDTPGLPCSVLDPLAFLKLLRLRR